MFRFNLWPAIHDANATWDLLQFGPVVQASCLTVEKVNPGGVIAAMQLG